VTSLLKRIGAPVYLNKYGSKTYTLAEKVHTLFLRGEWKRSFRGTKKDCDLLGVPCPSKSTLQYCLQRLPWRWLQRMLSVFVKKNGGLAALDGTTLSRSSASWHYVQRAGIDIRERQEAKLSILIDTHSKQVLAA
ncbi:MAG: hypothetical protein MN733_05765, partial [Nitrososphaera sp.]|nr:hypothetical protein [Nitrososphaera sp.]